MRLIDEIWTALVLHGRERVADTAAIAPPAVLFGPGELVMEEGALLGACAPMYLRHGQTFEIGAGSIVGNGFRMTGSSSVRIGRGCAIGANVSIVGWPDAIAGVTEIGDGTVIGDAATIVAGARIDARRTIAPAAVVATPGDGAPVQRRVMRAGSSEGTKRRSIAVGAAVLFAIVGWWPLVWLILLGFSVVQRSNAFLRAAIGVAIVFYVVTAHSSSNFTAGDNVIYGLIAFIVDDALRNRFPKLLRRYSRNG